MKGTAVGGYGMVGGEGGGGGHRGDEGCTGDITVKAFWHREAPVENIDQQPALNAPQAAGDPPTPSDVKTLAHADYGRRPAAPLRLINDCQGLLHV